MLNQLMQIGQFILDSFLHIWPYLLITIPLAVAVNLSGASKYITRAFEARPLMAIFLATIVGAFSPFCSCSVIPVVASLLIGGVPLAPVMAFWIASPSMDPEAFFLSVAALGWELAIWRMVGTLLLSFSAGLITHFVMGQGWLGDHILRSQPTVSTPGSTAAFLKRGWQSLKERFAATPVMAFAFGVAASGAELTVGSGREVPVEGSSSTEQTSEAAQTGSSCSLRPPSFRERLLKETGQATLMVAQFMVLAFFLEALITFYVPSEWIAGLVGRHNDWAILSAALIGVPVYTSNLAALPLVSGLLAQGMNPAAALAFLIAGPTTTLPAMAAVWNLTTRRVFALYLSFSLVGAILLGYLYTLVNLFFLR